MEDIHTQLITSEQQRIYLNQELQQLMSKSNKSERLKEIQLRSQLESLKLQRQKSLQRNEMIRRQMQEFDINLSVVSAKTQALRTLKNDYEDYIERLYPRWKEQVLARAAEQKEKEMRLSGMRRDVGLVDELAVPELSHSVHVNHQYSNEGEGYPTATLVNGRGSSNQSYGYTDDSPPGHSADYRVREPQQTTSKFTDPQYSAPIRASTPNYNGSLYKDRGAVSMSMLSMNSEKSVTFDESSLRPPLRSLDIPSHSQSKRAEFKFSSEHSPHRLTPSPSELIRMSITSTNSSREGSQSNLSDKSPLSSPPITSQPAHRPLASTVRTNISHSALTAPADTHYTPTHQTQYTDHTKESLSRPPTRPHLPSGISTLPATGVNKRPVSAGVSSSPSNGVNTAPATGVNSTPAANAKLPATIHRVQSFPEQSRFVGPQVVIPSSEDMAEDADSVTDSTAERQEVGGGVSSAHMKDQTDLDAQPPSSVAAGNPMISAPDVRHSQSSLNTTATEEQPAIDVTNTAEFKSLLAGSMGSTHNDYDSEDSEDSVRAAVESAYKQIALSKTNTIPVGHSMLSYTNDNEPSPDEEQSDDDSMSAPMGYTPSFASTIKPPNTDSAKPVSQSSTKAVSGPASLPTASSTGGSKNSSGSRKPAFLRTDSDVESVSDAQNLLYSGTNKKAADGTGNSDKDDDFDFYG